MRHLQRSLESQSERWIGGARRRSNQEKDERGQHWAELPRKIGPAAHVARSGTADTERVLDERLPAVLTEIRSLLDVPAGTDAPSRDEVEHTLTSGYAYALSLEGERLRIERRLRALWRSAAGSEKPSTDEVSELMSRLACADQELAGVRALLSSLRAQAL